jgi:hypothetical protein
MVDVALHWEKVPVLRNRKRAFMFFESPFDTFGPACNGVGCGEDLESTDDLKRPQRFDNDPLAAPVCAKKTRLCFVLSTAHACRTTIVVCRLEGVIRHCGR